MARLNRDLEGQTEYKRLTFDADDGEESDSSTAEARVSLTKPSLGRKVFYHQVSIAVLSILLVLSILSNGSTPARNQAEHRVTASPVPLCMSPPSLSQDARVDDYPLQSQFGRLNLCSLLSSHRDQIQILMQRGMRSFHQGAGLSSCPTSRTTPFHQESPHLTAQSIPQQSSTNSTALANYAASRGCS